MIKQISFIFVLFFLVWQINTQKSNNTNELTLNETLQISLSKQDTITYDIFTPLQQTFNEDLIIYITPKFPDPFQVPYISIISDQNYSQHCFNSNAQFAGICRIKSDDLNLHPNFTLSIKCAVNCNLILETYMSSVIKTKIGKSIELNAHRLPQLIEIVHIQIPEIQYTSLALMAVILNQQQNILLGDEGVDILINYGNKNILDPTQQLFQLKGTSLNGGGKGIFLSNQIIKPKQWIKIYIKIKQGINIRFSIIPIKGNDFSIQIGQPYYDFADQNNKKTYTLDLKSYDQILLNQTVQIVFDVYTGNPQLLVSFQSDFTQLVDFVQKQTAISLLISPQTRRKLNFKDKIYIRVISNESSEYYFYTQVLRHDVTYLQPYMTYFDEIQTNEIQNYLMIQRYRYPQDKKSLLKQYSFKIRIHNGKGNFYFKRCISLQNKNNAKFDDCLISNSNELKSKKFYDEQIQNKYISSGSIQTIYMLYDITKCTQQNKLQKYINVICVFQIIVSSQSIDHFSFSILPQRKYHTNYIRQGKIIKEYIPRNNYIYYVFNIPSLDQINQINIFLTALSGNAALIISKNHKLPTLSQNQIKQSGSKCNIVLSRDQIASQIYISIFAYQFTEVNLGVIVHRKDKGGSVHEIPLQNGNMQNYILNETQKFVIFKILTYSNEKISVYINQISGHVKMSISKDDKQIKCENISDRLYCKFQAQKNGNYRIRLQSDSIEAKFTITYKTQDNRCLSSILNHPIYVSMGNKQKYCYTFNINRQVSLIFTASYSHIQMLDRQITAKLYLNDKQSSVIRNSHRLITIRDMIQVCQMGLKSNSFPHSCRVSIQFENMIDNNNHFSFILQQQDTDIALFDGVNERVNNMRQNGEGRYFYYHVKQQKLIQIFFISISLKSHYYLGAKFVSNNQFLIRNELSKDLYPQHKYNYINRGKIDNRQNLYQSLVGLTGLQIISINKQDINKYCQDIDCYLLISVYSQKYQNNLQNDQDSYQIEVTQEQTILSIGQSKIGFINNGDIYTYIVNPQDAMIQIDLINRQKQSQFCLQMNAALADGTIIKVNQLQNNMQLLKRQNIQRIYIKGKIDNCSYKISYISNKNPYRIVRLSQPYQLSIQKGKYQKFIYYHHNSRTFKIAPMISIGQPKIYIKPIKQQNINLLELQKLSLEQYPISTSYNGQYSIQDTDPNFCSKCYYYILITSENKFIGQIIILRLYDPIPLTPHHIFKQHLIPMTVLGVQNYIYYSLTSFDITFNMLSGKMQLTIDDPSGNLIISEIISNKETFFIKSIQYNQKQNIQFYSQRTKYKMRVSVIQQSQFYVQISKTHASQRLFQGYPKQIDLKDQSIIFEFLNNKNLDKPLNLMIDLDQKMGEQVILIITIKGQTNNGSKLQNDKLLKNITKSDNTYIINLLNFNGTYYIDIKPSIKVHATFILVKQKLTHISPLQNYLFNNEGVYQIYANRNKVMIQIFNCQGQVDMFGSRDQRDMQGNYFINSPIKIKRPNYGGHYVFNLETTFSSYFIKILNKRVNETLLYLINYYYYQQMNPYDMIQSQNYDISIQRKKNGIYLSVLQPKLISMNKIDKNIPILIQIKSIVYNLYISLNKLDLNRYSRCHIEGNIAYKESNQSKILLQASLLDKIGVTNITQKVYSVIEAIVNIEVSHVNDNLIKNYPEKLTFYYNTFQIPVAGSVILVQEPSKKYWFTDSLILFIGWMILPFILASATLYTLFKYFLRKIIARQSAMVQQIQIIPSNQTVPTQQKIAQSGTLPQTGTQMVKQHI